MIGLQGFDPGAGKQHPHGSDSKHIADVESFGNIHVINKSMLISQADPMGDCSWSLPYPKTYETLPDILARAGDWTSVKLVMTDLMFLWRKLQGGNQMSLLHLYEKASLALFAQGIYSERLESFNDFFFHHLRHLSENPNLLFGMAAASRNEYVKQTLDNLLGKSESFVQCLYEIHSRSTHHRMVRILSIM